MKFSTVTEHHFLPDTVLDSWNLEMNKESRYVAESNSIFMLPYILFWAPPFGSLVTLGSVCVLYELLFPNV